MIRSVLFTALFVCTGVCSSWAAPVTQVQVHVLSVQEAVPPLVQKRIAASIQTVGNHILLNQDSNEIKEHTESYKRIMYDIVNRVLIGYTVDDIQIAGDSTADVTIKIRPWGQTIQSVQMDVDYGALPELGKTLANNDVADMSAYVENLLIGLPTDALEWANGAVKTVLEQELESRLPEFYPHIVIEPGKTAIVHVYFLPKLPIVRNVNVAIHAENLPKVIFLSTRKHLEEYYAGLEGLPVAFLRRHQGDMQQMLRQSVSAQWVVKSYKLRVVPQIDIGENTKITLDSQTDFYDIQAGMYMDVGRETHARSHDDDTVLRALVGRKIGAHHEVYGEVEWMPGSVSWNIKPGYFYRFGRDTRIGLHHETRDDSNHWWIRQPLGTNWQLRIDRDMTHHENEMGLLYRFHDYMGLEYIISNHDHWLRIVGYL